MRFLDPGESYSLRNHACRLAQIRNITGGFFFSRCSLSLVDAFRIESVHSLFSHQQQQINRLSKRWLNCLKEEL